MLPTHKTPNQADALDRLGGVRWSDLVGREDLRPKPGANVEQELASSCTRLKGVPRDLPSLAGTLQAVPLFPDTSNLAWQQTPTLDPCSPRHAALAPAFRFDCNARFTMK